MLPENFTSGAGFKAWWKCKEGHEWRAGICYRAGGKKTGCPYCSGHKPTTDNNFASRFPHLLKEWYFKKNDPRKPEEYTPSSYTKVWWKCEVGHEWQASISNRNRGNDCPYCSRRKK